MHEDLTKMTKEALLEHRSQIEKEIARSHNMQLAKKIQLNSAYGALG